MKKILAIGEIIWDVYPNRATIGGAPLNFAAHAYRCGLQSFLFSAVGNDGLGKEALSEISKFGICNPYIQKSGFPTGQCIVTLDENRIPSYRVLTDVAYDHILFPEQEIQQMKDEKFDAVYFGTLVQRDTDSRKTLQKLIPELKIPTVFCDINLRKDCFDRESLLFCLHHATILKISNEEEPTLRQMELYQVEDLPTEESKVHSPKSCLAICRAICKAYPNVRTVLLTLGGDGAYSFDADKEQEYLQPAIGETVVSTVGAGDSFAAAWMAQYLNGFDRKHCMETAAKVSGFVVAHQEAVPQYSISEL